MATAPPRAYGRSLGDFGQLWPQEEKLLAIARRGDDLIIGSGSLPAAFDRGANGLRARFVRFLVLGGDDGAPVHEEGVSVVGAWICGNLRLDGAVTRMRLALHSCVIDRISADDAEIGLLSLAGSRLPTGMLARRMKCPGGVYLRAGLTAEAPIDLGLSKVGTDVDCSNGSFANDAVKDVDAAVAALAAALAAERWRCDETTDPTPTDAQRVEARGLLMSGTTPKPALDLQGTLIERHLFLNPATVRGETHVMLARVDGQFELDGATLDNAAGIALQAYALKVGGTFGFTKLAAVNGNVDLRAAVCGVLADDIESWDRARGRLWLDGFTYARLAIDAETREDMRTRWLNGQHEDELGSAFKPQPWDQLIAVLKAMGHPNRARKIAVAKQERMHDAGKYTGVGGWLHREVYGRLTAYGYEPQRLLWWLAALWLGSSLLFWRAVHPGGHPPVYYLEPAKPEACVAGKRCPPPDYPSLFAPIYALDVLLPIVDFGLADAWVPKLRDDHDRVLVFGYVLRAVIWIDIAAGWIAGLLLAGIAGMLIRKD